MVSVVVFVVCGRVGGGDDDGGGGGGGCFWWWSFLVVVVFGGGRFCRSCSSYCSSLLPLAVVLLRSS